MKKSDAGFDAGSYLCSPLGLSWRNASIDELLGVNFVMELQFGLDLVVDARTMKKSVPPGSKLGKKDHLYSLYPLRPRGQRLHTCEEDSPIVPQDPG